MSFVNLIHSDLPQNPERGVGLRSISGTLGLSRLLGKQPESLAKVAEVAGYLLVIASLAVVFLTGQFPWFILMLVASLPLYALMANRSEK